MNICELRALMALFLISGLGPIYLKRLLDNFPSASDCLVANPSTWQKLGIPEKIIQQKNQASLLESANNLIATLDQEKINVLTYKDPDYPELLRQANSWPPVLLYQGQITNQFFNVSLGVVGSRAISSYGQSILPKILNELAGCLNQKLTIISGLAQGIDSLAHQTALDLAWPTVAVLGSGLDQKSFHPKGQWYLKEKILKSGGLIISQFPPTTQAAKQNFPMRNQTIAGLAQACLIVEAAEKSGSLITANLAINLNREVLAIPGNITQVNSQGTNNLIKQGARSITSAHDLAEALNLLYNKQVVSKDLDLTEEEKLICQILGPSTLQLDEIINTSKLPASCVSSCLTQLTLKNIVQDLGGQYYQLI